MLPSRARASEVVSANKVIGSKPEDLYCYSAQKWLWNESEQLLRRYVEFDIDALSHIAEKAAGEDAVCGNISKLPEGNFNKTFLATMRDGTQLVVKIPNPNSGPSHYTTASEVATMEYVRRRLDIPVPKILGYCSRAHESKLGAEYIVMEKAPGIELSRVWQDLKPRTKLSIVRQIAAVTCKLARSQFPCYGSLYKKQDITLSESIIIDEEFAIGPTTGRTWFDDRRGEVDIFRGPWISTENLVKALAQREVACIEKFPIFSRDCQQGIFNGPGGYHPTKEAKLAVLQDFLKVYSLLMPKDDELSAGVIWHNDLHTDNIFVDADDPSRITSIIDWQAAPVYPMFLIAHHPSLIEYEGPKLNGFVEPHLPENIKTLDPGRKQAAKELYMSQSFWLCYEIEVYKTAPALLQTFRFRETPPGQILGMIGYIFDDGEPYVQGLLIDVTEKNVWTDIVGPDNHGSPSVVCPLTYSEEDIIKHKTELAAWEKDIERKAQVIDAIGVYTGWNGTVSPDDYDEVARRLAAAKERFLDRESENGEQRALWEQVWPFQNHVK